MQRAPFELPVSDLERDRVGAFGHRDAGLERARAEIDRGSGEQRPSTQRCRLGHGVEGGGELPLRLLELDPPQPERQQGNAEAQGILGPTPEQGAKACTQIRRLRIQP